MPTLTPLSSLRLPDYPSAPLTLGTQPLCIFAEDAFPSAEDEPAISQDQNINNPTKNTIKDSTNSLIPPGLATILHNWHPNALLALLDTDAWSSTTWSVTLPPSPSTEKPARVLEIGRVGTQLTFGTLDVLGEKWEVMCTFNIRSSGEQGRGEWVANMRESMCGEEEMKSVEEVWNAGEKWVTETVRERVWQAGRGVKHSFHIEYAPMDIFGDGIKMSPHWLYSSLDLGKCTTCSLPQSQNGKMLDRCGRCGTAAYCSSECQKEDWKVHKWVCNMGLEDRGQAIRVAEKGGLYRWDVERTMVGKGESVESGNPFFEGVQEKRRRRGCEV